MIQLLLLVAFATMYCFERDATVLKHQPRP